MKITTPSAEATQPQSGNSVHGLGVLLGSRLTSGLHQTVSENNSACLCLARKRHPILADNNLDAISHLMGLLREITAINVPRVDAVSFYRAPDGAKRCIFSAVGVLGGTTQVGCLLLWLLITFQTSLRISMPMCRALAGDMVPAVPAKVTWQSSALTSLLQHPRPLEKGSSDAAAGWTWGTMLLTLLGHLQAPKRTQRTQP